MKKRLGQNLLLLTGSVLICLIGAEAAIRYLGAYDIDGNFVIQGRALRPFHLPILSTKRNAEEYRTSTGTRLMYDPHLGWVTRPGHKSADGLYAYNSLGARTDPVTPVEYPSVPAPSTLRIVLVGDSYTHGDEVAFENTWGHFLEVKLNESGINAEVINLAVGGYGIDQAFLRLLDRGADLSPAMVILGLQMENVERNVNLLKPLYQPNTGLPFSKPRFILGDGELQLINSPTLPPQKLPELLDNTHAWNLSAYEHFLRPQDYQPRLCFKSKLVALTREIALPVEAEPYFYDTSKEPAALTLSVLQAFKRRVEASGSRFIIVHIPIILDMVKLKLGRQPVYADLLASIEANNDVVRTQDKLLEATGWISLFQLFMPRGHYSPRGNELIAEVVAKHIRAQVMSDE
jgi:hypothetical protein